MTPVTIYAVEDDDDDTVYVNVSIGGTVAKERLEVLGNVRIFDTLKVGTSSLYFSGGPDRITSSIGEITMGRTTGTFSNFKLGIGTATPLATIDVNGTICSQALGGLGTGLVTFNNTGVFTPLVYTSSADVLLGNGSFANIGSLGLLSLNGGTISGNLTVNGILDASSFTLNGSPLVSSQWVSSGTDILYNNGNVAIGGNPTAAK